MSTAIKEPEALKKYKENPIIWINEVLIPFIKKNGSKRISQTTLDYYKRFVVFQPDCDKLVLVEERDDHNPVTVRAISVAVIREDKDVLYSVTITDPNYRKHGLGSAVLAEKIKLIRAEGTQLRTILAEDNEPAMRLCAVNGLKKVKTKRKERSTGFFNQVTWSS